MNLDEVIKGIDRGQYSDIAKFGRTKCYEVNSEYVVVLHNNKSNADRFTQLARELKPEEMKNIYTVVDYRMVRGIVYELQRRAKGEHFRIDRTKQSTLEELEYLRKSKEPSDESNQYIRLLELYMKTNDYDDLLDTIKDELMRRYSLIMQMPKEHIIDFFRAVLILQDHQVQCDNIGSNLLYNSESGFSLIDLEDLSKAQPNLRGSVSNMLNSYNDQTMVQLLGAQRIYRIPSDDQTECIETMKKALKKICISIIDFEYGSQSMTKEIMEESLKTYTQYGINLTYDEIIRELEKSKNTISNETIGKGTLKEQKQIENIDRTMQAIIEQKQRIDPLQTIK